MLELSDDNFKGAIIKSFNAKLTTYLKPMKKYEVTAKKQKIQSRTKWKFQNEKYNTQIKNSLGEFNSTMESTEIRIDELKIEKQKLPPLNSAEKIDCKKQQKQRFKDFGTIIKVLPCR